jgi:hypothetical protein
VAHRAEIAGAVVGRGLEGVAQRGPVAAAHLEAGRGADDVGDPNQVDAHISCSCEVGVEKSELAPDLALRTRPRGIPDDLHAAGERSRRAARGHGKLEREVRV